MLKPKLGLGEVFEALNDAKNGFGAIPGTPEMGGGLTITFGLWLSWVILPLGPWSLERGRGSGWDLVTPSSRSGMADMNHSIRF